MDLKGKSFLKLLDLTPAEIEGLLALAAKLKAEKKAGIPHKLCEGKNIVLLFAKDSTLCIYLINPHDRAVFGSNAIDRDVAGKRG